MSIRPPRRSRAHTVGQPPAAPRKDRLDAIIELVSLSARPMPLASFLDHAPTLLAKIFFSPVASLYLIEPDGETIVLRGNVGFGESALGQIRMRVGEGLTGLAIADGRPIHVEHGPSHDLFLGFPELDEERFPIFAAAPIIGSDGPIGGVVVQRADQPFSDHDLILLMSLSAAISSALRGSELHHGMSPNVSQQGKEGGDRRVLLAGRPLIAGRALGTIVALRRPPRKALAARSVDAPQRLKTAFRASRRALEGLRDRTNAQASGSDLPLLETCFHFLSDARFRERALQLVDAGASVGSALSQVAREVARAAVQISRDDFVQNRARDLEDFCDALAMLAVDAPADRLLSGAVLMADSLSVYELLIAARSRPVGVVLSEQGQDACSLAILRLLGLPALIEVNALFRWASEGDLALLDAQHGYLHINPSRLEVAEFKCWRKENLSRLGKM